MKKKKTQNSNSNHKNNFWQKFFVKNNLTPQQLMRRNRGSHLGSFDVFFLFFYASTGHPGKLLELRSNLQYFSNPGDNVIITAEVWCSQDLRVWHIRSNITLCLKEFPRAKPEGTPEGKGLYLIVYPLSPPNTDIISF